MTTVRLGILGTGLAVELLHWPALQHPELDFTIVALCDQDLAAAKRMAHQIGGDPLCTTDWSEFLAVAGLDAVLISLPIHLNAHAMRSVVQAGKHVLCEKPLAANTEQAQQLVAELQHVPVVVAIAENFHYRDDFKQARHWIDQGLIGEPIMIAMQAHFWANTEYGFSSTAWRQNPQYRGSVVADAAVHHVAAFHELGGPIERLQAFTRDVHPTLAGIDTLCLNLRFRSGCLGQLMFSAAVQPPTATFDHTTVFGTAGSITVERGVATLFQPDKEPDYFRSSDPQGYVAEFRNFQRAITLNEPVIVTPEVALADWLVVMRALDSAEGSDVVLF